MGTILIWKNFVSNWKYVNGNVCNDIIVKRLFYSEDYSTKTFALLETELTLKKSAVFNIILRGHFSLSLLAWPGIPTFKVYCKLKINKMWLVYCYRTVCLIKAMMLKICKSMHLLFIQHFTALCTRWHRGRENGCRSGDRPRFDCCLTLIACGSSDGKEVNNVFGRLSDRIGVGSALEKIIAANGVQQQVLIWELDNCPVTI